MQTTVAAFALLEAQPIPPKSPPPEGARVRMKKGLHLAMKAFYFGSSRITGIGGLDLEEEVGTVAVAVG
ncbi:hypothetical protein, partial [Burkholderia ubonensis]|uniref:hypothetical protein n=1 Tax=Burkholderia ubonensis TaxID=101571 RepID=UPI0012FC6E9E